MSDEWITGITQLQFEAMKQRAEKAEALQSNCNSALKIAIEMLEETKAKLGQAEKERDEARRKFSVVTGKLAYYHTISGTQHDGSDVDLEVCSLCGYADGHDDDCFVQRLEGFYEAEADLKQAEEICGQIQEERDQLRAEKGELEKQRSEWRSDNERLRAEKERLRKHLELILPMAKGYQRYNDVGSNWQMIEEAQQALAAKGEAK